MEDEFVDTLTRNDIHYRELSKMDYYLKKIPTLIRMKRAESPESVTSPTKVKQLIKLPKLQLEKFDGKIQNCRSCCDRFVTSIDSTEFLLDVEKFNYLVGLFDENAKECVTGLTLTTENYQHAKDILRERYSNPQVFISIHMESLVKLPVVKSMN